MSEIIIFKYNIIRQFIGFLVGIILLYILQYYELINTKYFFIWFSILQLIIYYLYNVIFDLLFEKYRRFRDKNGDINI